MRESKIGMDLPLIFWPETLAFIQAQATKDATIQAKINAGVYKDPGNDKMKRILIIAGAGLLVYAIARK